MNYREFKIIGDGKYNYKMIVHNGSGRVPKELSGIFTTNKVAVNAIDSYLNKKGKTDGTTKSTSRGKQS